MACYVCVPCPKRPIGSYADLLRSAGFEALPETETMPAPRDFEKVWIKGTLKPEPLCRCGHTAEFLCDQPIGKGKTCDLPLCYCCRTVIGDDYDLCPVHAASWSGSNPPVQQALFQGPRLVKSENEGEGDG